MKGSLITLGDTPSGRAENKGLGGLDDLVDAVAPVWVVEEKGDARAKGDAVSVRVFEDVVEVGGAALSVGFAFSEEPADFGSSVKPAAAGDDLGVVGEARKGTARFVVVDGGEVVDEDVAAGAARLVALFWGHRSILW
jgi:hypothetical protein